MNVNLILFFILAGVAIAAALGMLFSRNSVYSALFLIMNFVTVAVFYLLLQAPFIAISQVTVYAGAIMVLFLFVIMLLGAEETRQTGRLWWNQPLALALGVILLAETVFIMITQHDIVPATTALTSGFGDPREVGLLLFSQNLLPFEATSILLLVAMIGAIVLTKTEKKKEKKEESREEA